MSNAPLLLCEINSRGVVTLNRPQAFNALSEDTARSASVGACRRRPHGARGAIAAAGKAFSPAMT
jgi:enoyl-CoA hydratase/carnithine racemase